MENFYIRSGIMTQLPAPYRCIHLLQRSAGFFMALHSHPFYHIAFATSGVLTVTFNEQNYEIEADRQFCFHQIFRMLSIQNVGTAKSELIF